jgi:hypothetical protein
LGNVEEEASGNEDEHENSNADLDNEEVDGAGGNTGQPLVPRSVPQETERVHQKYGKVSVSFKILKSIIIYLDLLMF